MDFKLELVLIPVSDVDPAKTYYIEQTGFTLNVDHRASDELRIMQLTPWAWRARPPWERGSRRRRRAPFQLAGLDGTRTGATIARATRLSGISTCRCVSHAGGAGVRTNQPGTCRVPGDSIHPGPGAMRSQPHSPQRGQHMPTTSGRHPFAALRPVCPC